MTEDRVWSLAASTTGLLRVGTAGTRGTCPLRLYDLATGAHVLDISTWCTVAQCTGEQCTGVQYTGVQCTVVQYTG